MPTVTQSIQSFLKARKATHNGPDLIERYLRFSPYMETQVNVCAGRGFPVDTKRSTYTDGIDEWFNVRIPKNANSNPVFRDYELHFPLDEHAESIGCTGWDWSNRCSRWVGFDFDSITGHAAGVGVGKDELLRVREAAKALPYVEVRNSTGGLGLHLYVLFDDKGIPTANHTEHAALGRAVLGMMSSETGFDFATQIDACGGNMWIWARKMSASNQGLRLLKPASKPLGVPDLPANWHEHIEVVTRKRSKVRVKGIEEGDYDPFEALASSRQIIQLDDKHKQIIEELQRLGLTTQWVQDHHLLQTHTVALQRLMDEKKTELGLVGFFKTISAGDDPGQPNCFAFPLDAGGWKVYKFSPGNVEDATWDQDGQGWTTCNFNRSPTLKVAARATGGIEDAEKGGFVFDTLKSALAATEALGQKIDLPEGMSDRTTVVKTHKDGRLTIKMDKDSRDETGQLTADGWLSKKDYWVRVFELKPDRKNEELSATEFDNEIRALDSIDGKHAGWVARQDSGAWIWQPKDNIRNILLSMEYTKPEVEIIIGKAAKKSWKLVNIPFHPEFPGNRQWNMRAPKYRYTPAELSDDQVPHHPHWDKVLKHCGQDLDDAIRDSDWARNANIRSGADYLMYWAACMLRHPYDKLPYLFFYGSFNAGKSIFHEALTMLMEGGMASADRAFTSDFNGELANAVLAVVEERDISNSPGAYNRLKDLVTSPVVWIRKMRTDAYPQANTLHFIHVSNERGAIVIKFGDVRIVVIFVPDLDPGQEIPKPVLLERLDEEAPHFMRTLMDLKLPPMTGRLRLPIILNSTKERAEELCRTPLEMFIADHCHSVPGAMIPFKEFYERFVKWLEDERPPEFGEWLNKFKVISALPHQFPYGKHTANVRYIGNISWDADEPPKTPFTMQGGRLKPKG